MLPSSLKTPYIVLLVNHVENTARLCSLIDNLIVWENKAVSVNCLQFGGIFEHTRILLRLDFHFLNLATLLSSTSDRTNSLTSIIFFFIIFLQSTNPDDLDDRG